MKTALPLALVALLVLPGCSADDRPSLCNGTPSVGTPSLDALLFPVNAPASMRVDIATLTLLCESGQTAQKPDTASAEVFDPENHVVPAEVSLDASGSVATLQFTPTAVGRHHVILAFTPVGGIRQLGVYVASPWAGSASSLTLPLPRCGQLERTTNGLWLCDGVALRNATDRPLRLGSTSQVPDVSVSGNIVWVVGEGRVRRYVDTGKELELTGSLLLSTTVGVSVIQSRLASEHELVVLDGERLHRFVFTDTGVLAATPPKDWVRERPPVFGIDNTTGLLVRVSSERLLAVRVLSWQPAITLACPFQLGPDGAFTATDEPCAELPGIPYGLEWGVLWTYTGAGMAPSAFGRMLHRWVGSEGRLVEQGSLILDAALAVADSALRGGFTVPTLNAIPRNNTALARPRGGPGRSALGLELMPTDMPLSEGSRSTSPRFHWGGDSRPSVGFTTVYEQALP